VTPLAPGVHSGYVTGTRRTVRRWFGGAPGEGAASRRRAMWRRPLLRLGTQRRARNSQMAIRAVLGASIELLTTEAARDGGHGELRQTPDGRDPQPATQREGECAPLGGSQNNRVNPGGYAMLCVLSAH